LDKIVSSSSEFLDSQQTIRHKMNKAPFFMSRESIQKAPVTWSIRIKDDDGDEEVAVFDPHLWLSYSIWR
jgi:hypothetical protein